MIKCVNLSIGYSEPIIENINLEINQNDFLLIIGKNGSGKSTLIKTILGLEKPLSGKIELSQIKRNDIGYVAQINELRSDFKATTWEVIISGMLNKLKTRLYYNKQEKKKAEEIMRKLRYI